MNESLVIHWIHYLRRENAKKQCTHCIFYLNGKTGCMFNLDW